MDRSLSYIDFLGFHVPTNLRQLMRRRKTSWRPGWTQAVSPSTGGAVTRSPVQDPSVDELVDETEDTVKGMG